MYETITEKYIQVLRVQVTQQKDLIFQMSIPQKRSFLFTQLQE